MPCWNWDVIYSTVERSADEIGSNGFVREILSGNECRESLTNHRNDD